MSLNAHLAFFETHGTPDTLIPVKDQPEATEVTIPGSSGTVPSDGLTPPAAPPPEQQWIELTEVQFYIRSDTAEFHNLEVTKDKDIASPLLAFHCAQQTRFASVKILRLDATNSVVEVIRLYGVRIASVRGTWLTSNTGSQTPATATFSSGTNQTLEITNATGASQTVKATETITLTYDQVVWTFAVGTEKGWDRATNTEFSAPT